MTPDSPEAQALAQQQARKDQILGNLRRMLDYRRQFDPRRALFYRQYVGQRDPQVFPDNKTKRSNTFVPYPLSNVETVVSRTNDAFFSYMPWFECDPDTAADDHAAEAMQLVLEKKLHEAKSVDAVEQLIRTIAIYGFGALKVDWNWDFKTITKPVAQPILDPNGQPVIDPNSGVPLQRVVSQTFQVPMACPRITPIDIYDLLVDPDGYMVAHMTEKPLGLLLHEQMVSTANGSPLYDPAALAKLRAEITAAYSGKGDPTQVLVRYAEFWNRMDNTQTLITFGDDADAIGYKEQRASYRSHSYESYKPPVWSGSGDILYSGENQFAHKRVPILYTSYIKLPNEIYGLGIIETTADLTESLNKMVNMITDNWNLGINRRYAYDENADIDHEALNQMNVPGGKVAVNGNPNEVIAPLPMFTPAAGDYQLIEIYRGLIESTSGISDFYSKGVGSAGGNSTATGISSVINESNYRFKLFIRNLEIDVLQPMLEMCASMCQQFLTDAQEVQITKSQAPGFPKWAQIPPEALIGNFGFNLVAANYATNKQVRQRNLMSFMQIAAQTPYWRQGEGLREIGKVMEIRNINDLIKSDQEVQMEQEQQMQQQMQMQLAQEVLGTESKMAVARAKHQGQVASGGRSKAKEGRTPKAQFEGAAPGQTAVGMMKSIGQSMGANALGLEGLGEVANAAG